MKGNMQNSQPHSFVQCYVIEIFWTMLEVEGSYSSRVSLKYLLDSRNNEAVVKVSRSEQPWVTIIKKITFRLFFIVKHDKR